MNPSGKAAWKVSLHGGHSAAYCDHGSGLLRDVVEAAVARGFHTYGLAEHAPRYEVAHVFAEEVKMGWDLARLHANFEAYAAESAVLVSEFSERITLLRGFEAEVVPQGQYVGLMQGLRTRHHFDYIVGSVHWVEGIIIDYSKGEFDRAVNHCGGFEPFAVRYYETVRDMVQGLRPEVVGHLDVIRRYADPDSAADSPAIRRAAAQALEAIRENGAILDLNTSALRRGLNEPFPASWLLRTAVRDFEIPVCFGDDSHGPADVGACIPEGREYLLKHGVKTITCLARESGDVIRTTIPLE